ncbi:hypothetical protein ATZ33_17280 [Enterococcus silesiacus]|uniref:DNA-binding protein n=1 Tax=Enterococcus silesiacus TaxID=332949 RepID=A0A0S3KFJ6_9ENTE|nr:hypothetical protein [Enterococcus silesiacus]ALS03066.1 hypothetical protein ATZ33_17280 [Enterococcus silesiacus]OJG93012.1 hypothetical protein RV15_GL002146 [Enterococcus silesiacus]
MAIKVELILSDEVKRDLINEAKRELEEEFEERLNLVSRILDLPPAPNKSEIRKILKISDSTLDHLIANGATPMIWGENTIRIERANILKAFDNTKIKI